MNNQEVRIQLQSSVIYVTGTVNGETASFSPIGGGEWAATVARSPDNRYVVDLYAYDAAGNSTQYKATLFYGIDLITDRTEEDVDYVAGLTQRVKEGTATADEREEWLTGELKGAYNATDLNRVGAAVQYLTNLLAEYGYHVGTNAKIDWTESDLQNADSMAVYLANVQKLVEAYFTLPNAPPLPTTMSGLDWQEANAIEENLRQIEVLVGNMIDNYRYCNDVISGEGYFS